MASDQDACFQELLNSFAFRKAPTLRRLLEYLWQHRDEHVSEYGIAIDVLGRRADFDPKTDSAVRVHILRLRQKLREYYEAAGSASHTRFTIPQGELGLRTEAAIPVSRHVAEPPTPQHAKKLAIFWPALAFALAVTAAAGWYLAFRSSYPAARSAAILPPFWQRAIANGKSTRLVIPSPVFLKWRQGGLRARDVQVNDFNRVSDSADLEALIAKYGAPELSQSYSTLASSIAAVALSQYLAVRGYPIGIAAEGQLGLDAFTNENLIFLGFPHASRWIATLPSSCNFQAEPDVSSIGNRHPVGGEPDRYYEKSLSATRRVRPHLIALLPGKEHGTAILVISSQYASSVPFLTSPSGMQTMDKLWRENGRPAWFEAVLMAETEGESLVRATVGGFRAIR